MKKSHLPTPDAQSLAHSAKVAAHIQHVIAEAGGQISFADFMHRALYAPGLGYYAAGATKFGAAGDFVTAPEISPLFTRVLGRQVAATLGQLDAGYRCLFEPGAGTGAVAAELLSYLHGVNALPDQYFILEVSAELRERQAAAIEQAVPAYLANVHWLDGWPDAFSGVVIANEVLDALPVERFVRTESGVLRQLVRSHGDGFMLSTDDAPPVIGDALHAIETELGRRLPPDYTSEVSLGAAPWIAELSESLDRAVVFLFDYGVSRREYYAEDRNDGWLRCYLRHHVHDDALIYPGIQDLTAWVDFSSVAAAASESGMQVAAYVTQGAFLMHGGLQHEIEGFAGLPTAAQLQLSNQIKVLTMPGEMGENIKCLVLSKGGVITPRYLADIDRAHTL